MPNPTSQPSAAQTIMPLVSGVGANPGPAAQQRTPMLGQNVQVAQPRPDRPVSIPEAVMMQAMMRRMNS